VSIAVIVVVVALAVVVVVTVTILVVNCKWLDDLLRLVEGEDEDKGNEAVMKVAIVAVVKPIGSSSNGHIYYKYIKHVAS